MLCRWFTECLSFSLFHYEFSWIISQACGRKAWTFVYNDVGVPQGGSPRKKQYRKSAQCLIF